MARRMSFAVLRFIAIEMRRLLDRNVAGAFALEDPSNHSSDRNATPPGKITGSRENTPVAVDAATSMRRLTAGSPSTGGSSTATTRC